MLHRRTTLLWLVFFAFGLTAPLAAQERTAQQQMEVVKLQEGIADFFTDFNNPTVGPEQAFTALVGKGPLKDRADDLTKLIGRAKGLEGSYGKYTGYDAASVKTVGND